MVPGKGHGHGVEVGPLLGEMLEAAAGQRLAAAGDVERLAEKADHRAGHDEGRHARQALGAIGVEGEIGLREEQGSRHGRGEGHEDARPEAPEPRAQHHRGIEEVEGRGLAQEWQELEMQEEAARGQEGPESVAGDGRAVRLDHSARRRRAGGRAGSARGSRSDAGPPPVPARAVVVRVARLVTRVRRAWP